MKKIFLLRYKNSLYQVNDCPNWTILDSFKLNKCCHNIFLSPSSAFESRIYFGILMISTSILVNTIKSFWWCQIHQESYIIKRMLLLFKSVMYWYLKTTHSTYIYKFTVENQILVGPMGIMMALFLVTFW